MNLAELSAWIAGAPVGTESKFALSATIVAVGQTREKQGRQGGAYQEQALQVSDGGPPVWMNFVPPPLGAAQGLAVTGEGKVKKGDRATFWDVRKAVVVGAHPPTPPPTGFQPVGTAVAQALAGVPPAPYVPPAPPPASAPAAPARTVESRLKLWAYALGRHRLAAEAALPGLNPHAPEVAAALIAAAGGTCQGWEKGLAWEPAPEREPGEDDDLNF